MFFYMTWQGLKVVTGCGLERYDILRLPGCRKTQVMDCLWSESADFHDTDFRRRPDRNTSRILFLFFRNRPLILLHMLATKSRLLNSFAALLAIIIKMPFYIFAQKYKVSFYILLPDVRNGDAGCFLKVTYYLCRIVALPRIGKLRDNANIK